MHCILNRTSYMIFIYTYVYICTYITYIHTMHLFYKSLFRAFCVHLSSRRSGRKYIAPLQESVSGIFPISPKIYSDKSKGGFDWFFSIVSRPSVCLSPQPHRHPSFCTFALLSTFQKHSLFAKSSIPNEWLVCEEKIVSI